MTSRERERERERGGGGEGRSIKKDVGQSRRSECGFLAWRRSFERTGRHERRLLLQ